MITTTQAIRYDCELIWSYYPDCQIIITTMLQRGIADMSTIFELGNLVRECAGRLAIPIIDQQKESGIYGFNEIATHKFLIDGTHLSDLGKARIGAYMSAKLKDVILV